MNPLGPGELRRRGGLKWSRFSSDVLPAWVAEMDFPIAPEIIHSVQEAVRLELFGYPSDQARADLSEACAQWLARAHGWDVDPDRVHVVPDVLSGIELAIELHSADGSPVILPTPAYPPLFDVVARCRRPIVEVVWPDLDQVEDAFAGGARTLLLCNPHNPLGTVASAAELAELATVVQRHRGRVVADEVHAPLIYPGHRHVPYASVSEAAAGHTVTLTSASKGWNLPGLSCAQVVLSNAADQRVWTGLSKLHTWGASSLGIIAGASAFQAGGDWLTAVLAELDHNRRHLGELVSALLPDVGYRIPDGTYLAWLDCRGLGLPVEPAEFFLAEAGVALSPGAAFGPAGRGHARLNFATSSETLAEMVERMARAR